MSTVMLRLPLTSVLLTTLLLASDGLAVMPEPVKRSETSGRSSWGYLSSDSILDGVWLIQTFEGSSGALGGPRWNRSGCAR